MLKGELRVYVYSPKGKWDVEICRVPREDLHELRDEAWVEWLASGRVPAAPPDPPDPVYDAAWKEWLKKPVGPMPKRKRTTRAILRSYEHKRFLIAEQKLDRWLGRGASKTGAPGRPSNMALVLDEFERRRKNNETEKTRDAQAKSLAAWFQSAHPGSQSPSPKTISHKLPRDFRPRLNFPK